jgi:hypothetical protein
MRALTSLLGLVTLCVPSLSAQTPRDTVPTVIRAGRVFDSERGTMTGPQEILVVDGRIEDVATKVGRPRALASWACQSTPCFRA